MTTAPLIVATLPLPASILPHWDQLPPQHQQELIAALALLLLRLPEVQALLDKPHDRQH
jgi:hypothetical protein